MQIEFEGEVYDINVTASSAGEAPSGDCEGEGPSVEYDIYLDGLEVSPLFTYEEECAISNLVIKELESDADEARNERRSEARAERNGGLPDGY